MGGKEAFTSPPASRKRRVTPSIGKRKRRQEELTDQPRRSKRRQIYSDPTSIPVTPSAPSSSIRDTARILSVSGSGGSREYTGSTYSLEAVLSKRTLSSPHPGHADATEKPGDETAVSDGPRHCYCDEYCQACTSITPCELHDGFYCSGCDDWFHAACTGWEIKGEFPNRYMESKMYPDFKIQLDSLSQEDSQPWYCIRCWETKKFEDAAFIPWVECSLEHQAFRLGVEVDYTVKPTAMQHRIDEYVEHLQATLPDKTLRNLR
jgi:hypothetical protein